MTISKVKSVNANGTWKDLFKFEYEMENGDHGGALHKTETPKYPIGTEVEYEVEVKGDYTNIKFKQQDSKPWTGGNGKPSSNSPFAMSYAKDLAVAGKIELGQLNEYAKKMLDWMNENK